jgi:hypothetical protein
MDRSQGTLSDRWLGAGCDNVMERHRLHHEVRDLDVGAREMLRDRMHRTRGGAMGVRAVMDRVDASLEEQDGEAGDQGPGQGAPRPMEPQGQSAQEGQHH